MCFAPNNKSPGGATGYNTRDDQARNSPIKQENKRKNSRMLLVHAGDVWRCLHRLPLRLLGTSKELRPNVCLQIARLCCDASPILSVGTQNPSHHLLHDKFTYTRSSLTEKFVVHIFPVHVKGEQMKKNRTKEQIASGVHFLGQSVNFPVWMSSVIIQNNIPLHGDLNLHFPNFEHPHKNYNHTFCIVLSNFLLPPLAKAYFCSLPTEHLKHLQQNK